MTIEEQKRAQKPTENDINKIGTEMVQLMNQRFVMANLAITLSISFIAWTMSRTISEINDIITTVALGSALSFIIFALYLMSRNMHKSLRVFTTYLVVTESSNWEVHFKKYREMHGKKSGLPNVFVYMFPCLIVIPSVVPLMTIYANWGKIGFNIPFKFYVMGPIISVILCIIAFIMEAWMKEMYEEEILKNWKKVIKN